MQHNLRGTESGTVGTAVQNQPLIFEIKGSSIDDGPGIRTVVFFKGCPLSCVWCHNPESKRAGSEVSLDREKCIGCGSCIGSCANKAISDEAGLIIDRNRCDNCFTCVDSCPAGALEQIGKPMSIDDIAIGILKDKAFYDVSGGGVTLSGGEPLLNINFASELLSRLKDEGIHTLIETSGVFKFSSFEEMILPYTNTVFMDIKLIDPLEHKRYCGLSNELILNNFNHLKDASNEGGIMFLPRVPLVPGITDTTDNLKGIAGFLADHQWKRVRLLPYNPLWLDKCLKTGITPPIKVEDAMKSFMPADKIDACKAVFAAAKIKVV